MGRARITCFIRHCRTGRNRWAWCSRSCWSRHPGAACINGLLTLRGAWDKVREEPMLKFMVVAVTAYGMATLEGPTLAIKSVNAFSHYTDWTIAHVHTGALGWNGFLTFSMLYWLFPRLYNTKLWSTKLANYHFWVGLLGMMFYVVPMYTSGITQGLMWKQFNKDGFLQYPNFLETTIRLIPMYELRAIGGSLYITGIILMLVNLYKTAKAGQFIGDQEAQAPAVNTTAARESMKLGHRWLEGVPVTFHRPGPVRRSGGRADRDHPDVSDQGERAHHRQRQALHPAGSAWARHLHSRGLRRLPFANDSAVPLRDRTVRRIFESRRIRV